MNFGKIILTKPNLTESFTTHTTLNTGALLVPLIKKKATVPKHIGVNFNACNNVAIIAQRQYTHLTISFDFDHGHCT